MTLLELIRSLDTPSVESLAKRSGTNAGNLKQIAHGFRRAGPGLAINLERESSRAVRRANVRAVGSRRLKAAYSQSELPHYWSAPSDIH